MTFTRWWRVGEEEGKVKKKKKVISNICSTLWWDEIILVCSVGRLWIPRLIFSPVDSVDDEWESKSCQVIYVNTRVRIENVIKSVDPSPCHVSLERIFAVAFSMFRCSDRAWEIRERHEWIKITHNSRVSERRNWKSVIKTTCKILPFSIEFKGLKTALDDITQCHCGNHQKEKYK